MQTAARVGAIALVLLLATACARAVGGEARPAPGLVPAPLTGEKVKQVLLGEDQLSTMLHQSLTSDPDYPLRFGGVDQLDDGDWASATPADCVGAAWSLQRSAYQQAQVQTVATQSWPAPEGSGPFGDDPDTVAWVDEGVIALATTAAATAQFEKFVDQWRRCEGVTVDSHDADPHIAAKVTEVESDGSVLIAIIEVGVDETAESYTRLVGHSVGVRANCLVETSVLYQTLVEPDDYLASSQIARAMMNNVANLT